MSEQLDIGKLLTTIQTDITEFANRRERKQLERLKFQLRLFSYVHQSRIITVEQYLSLTE